MIIKRLSESLIQSVGFGIQKRIYKGAAVRSVFLPQIQGDISMDSGQFPGNAFQWMAFMLSGGERNASKRHFIRTIGTDEQYPA